MKGRKKCKREKHQRRMTIFHLFISSVYLILSNIIKFHEISCEIFINLYFEIDYFYKTLTNQQKRYRRENSLTDLHELIVENRENRIRHAISMDISLNLVDHSFQTPLYYACQRGRTKLVQYLLEHGARHDLFDLNRISPLWIASKQGFHEIVLLLLEHGADPNHRSIDQTTSLYQASYYGHLKCVYHLIRYKARVDYAKNSGASPLFVAARNGFHRIVKHLLKFGADPNQCQEDLRSPLHTALLNNRVRCVRILLRHINIDCLIQQKDIYEWNHFHFLAKKGSYKSARVLFHHLKKKQKEMNFNEQDSFGNTPIHIALFNKKSKFLQYLLKKNVDINQPNCFGWNYHQLKLKFEESLNLNICQSKDYFENLLSIHLIKYTDEDRLISEEIQCYVKELLTVIERINPLFRSEIICSGSFYENTRVGLPDEFDLMIDLIEIEHLAKFIEVNSDPPGYGRLYPDDSYEAFRRLVFYLDPKTSCLSAEKIRKQFYQLLTSARSSVINRETSSHFKHLKLEWTSDDKQCGTAIHVEWYGVQYPYLSIKIDVVPCLTIYSWPRTATFDCPLEKHQFHIIPRSPQVNESFLWRISMSQLESIHLQNISLNQKNGYLILKCLRILFPFKSHIGTSIYTNEDLLTSYMFKNEFFHELYRFPFESQWINGSLTHRIFGILKRLHKHLLLGSINSFFIQNYNIIDLNEYKQIRSIEIQYLRTILSHLKEKFDFIQKTSLRRHTITHLGSTQRKPRLRQRAFTHFPEFQSL
ncbi:unnamed protein product [Adineta ricciae]|uniref:Mab-21-like nucleotidyltransferase domain-containing protein n=1 Tax=Adineta ricciae TaxID=249248 RepID=A0A815ARD0_ADIRI|nr:unnamed protein product [Adineta ricciae]CAF1260223.1 unnamed protein product [Adineta ricciae]